MTVLVSGCLSRLEMRRLCHSNEEEEKRDRGEKQIQMTSKISVFQMRKIIFFQLNVIKNINNIIIFLALDKRIQ